MNWDYDVIIVGGGGAGLSAAITANAAGARCMILEADKKLGGATALSGGVFYAAGTSVQREAGIMDDTPEAMLEYVATLNQWSIRFDLIKIMADVGAECVDWLIDLGVEFPPEWLACAGVESIARGHASRAESGGIAGPLINAAGAAGIETALATRVDGLVFKDGRVVGVKASGMELYAPSVIITTGGFGNNPAMIKRLYPDAAYHDDRVWAVHEDAPFILGDGINMAEQIGAEIVGHNSGLLLPTSGFMHSVEPWLPPWLMVVNEQGRRFMPESAYYSVSGYLVSEQRGRHAFAIFDDPTLREASADASHADPYHTGIPVLTWDEPTIRRHVESGRVRTAQTLPELAALCGINAKGLEQTVSHYNADCEKGSDSAYNKKATKLFPVAKPPFYAVEVRPTIIGLTGAGLNVDTSTRVLDAYQRPIPGLYAAGEVLGCIHSKRYAGGGMAIANAIIFGRIAGETAALAASLDSVR